MKKTFITLLVAGLSFSIISCGSNKDNKETMNTAPSQSVEETKESILPSDEVIETDSTVGGNTTETGTEDDNQANGGASQNSGNTIGSSLRDQFFEEANSNASISPTDMAEALITNNALGADFSAVTMEIEPGMLNGFDNAEITGFEEGTMFAPMIGSIPFVGYVFQLADGTDSAAFMDNLRSNANPAWNICTRADETIIEEAGNLVLFVMCPSSFE